MHAVKLFGKAPEEIMTEIQRVEQGTRGDVSWPAGSLEDVHPCLWWVMGAKYPQEVEEVRSRSGVLALWAVGH